MARQIRIPTAAKLAKMTGHNERSTRARLSGERIPTPATLLAYCKALGPRDRGAAFQIVEHFARLEGQRLFGFPVPNEKEEARERMVLERAEQGTAGEITWGPVVGQPTKSVVGELLTEPGPTGPYFEVRRFTSTKHAAAYHAHLRGLVEAVDDAGDDDAGDAGDDAAAKAKAKAVTEGAE